MGEPQRPQTAGWVAACPLICCVIRSVGAPALTPVPAPPPPLPRYYKKVDEPLLTGAQLAALAAAESADSSSSGAGTGESGARKGQEAQQAQQGELAKQAEQAEQAELPPHEQVAPVPPELKAQLAHYRWAACLCYDYNTGGCGASSGGWSCCCRQQVAAARLSLAVCGMG